MGHFEGFFEGAETNIRFAPVQKKINLQDFQNQRYIGIFMSLREGERKREGGGRRGERE